MTWCRAMATARLSAAGIFPDGLATTVIRGSAAPRARAICSVWSADGPTARSGDHGPAAGAAGGYLQTRVLQHLGDQGGDLGTLGADEGDVREQRVALEFLDH